VDDTPAIRIAQGMTIQLPMLAGSYLTATTQTGTSTFDMSMDMGMSLLSPLPAHLTLTLSIDLPIADSRSGSPIPKRSAGFTRIESQTERKHHEIRKAAAKPVQLRQSVRQSGSQAGGQPWGLSSDYTTAGDLSIHL